MGRYADTLRSLATFAPCLPSAVRGDRSPSRGLDAADDISPAAVFLSSDAASMVTGAEFEVTGGDSAKNI